MSNRNEVRPSDRDISGYTTPMLAAYTFIYCTLVVWNMLYVVAKCYH